MNSSSAYTHLESLLLFQSLHAHGLDPQVFSRISELLKSNPHITSDRRFQSGRLSPDALRNFYLHILKEEIKSEQNAVDGEIKNSRKRKAPSPSLPTIQESVQHQHLIPKLVNKLYARYRTAIVDQIRQEEEQYERLQKDLQSIERGEWDEQLRDRANGKSASRSPNHPKKPPLPPQNQVPPKPEPARVVPTPPPTDGPQEQQQPHVAPPKVPPLQNGQSHTESSAKAVPRKKQTPATSSPTPQPPLAPVPLSQQNRSSQAPAPSPVQASQPPPNVAPNGSPYPTQRSPYPQAQPQLQSQNAPSLGSPHPPNQLPPPHPQAGSPPGPYLQPHPPHPFPPNGIPSYGPTHSAQFSPNHQRYPGTGPYQGGSQSPSVQPQQQHPRNHVPYSGQSPYPPQQQMGQPPPPQGGFMLPPFQVSPQDPSRAHQQPAFPPQHAQVSTPTNSRHTAKGTPQSATIGRAGHPPMHPLVTQARLSFSTPTGMRTPPSAFSTPRSATSIIKASTRNWKQPEEVAQPVISPIDDIVPTLPQSQPKPKASRKSRAKVKTKDKEPEKDTQPEPETQSGEGVPEMETRQGRSRRKAPAKKARPGSIASSQAGTSVRDRSRSQSILSHTDTVAADNESQAGSRIKSERGNSIDVIEEDLTATPQMTTRRRGGNMQQSQQPSNKRKRNARETTPEEVEERSGTPELPRTVTALRHFSRMCAPLMNDISSHKHASIFTTAVRAKDAEGYYEIIKRPTDLKTIQKGIAAGAKQVAAAASGDTPAGSPGGGGAVVELPMTPENMPPKAIVNSAQLEKELMRMFVNAVMFNAGEDGVVVDARETFESVQQSVSSWRNIERGSGRLEVEETPPVQEEEAPISKRRKL
ncbi:hypothetical protein CC80DRAFT_487260 [Byssothecium circinans]|uniref:Bromo domain-containing protein n=1 Tax=Byssothecium circinans TaxID=147558 RepID=A0A6A5UGA1_9PLEO|nr:hypothetical protein CC80DRAFT_487260 [Byssothecium circinans]